MHHWRHGSGSFRVLALHESGATAEVWRPFADSIGSHAELIACDRPGWGWTPAPQDYVRTTVGEQASIALDLMDEIGADLPWIVCGAGIGAVIALELSLREPDRFLGSILIEPPLLAFSDAATESLSADVQAIGQLVADDGRDAVLDAYLDGRFDGLGPGAERIPAAARATGPEATTALLAELGAVPAWVIPEAALAAARTPALVVTGASTPAVLGQAASGLAAILARSDQRLCGPGLPHHDCASEVADLITELADAA